MQPKGEILAPMESTEGLPLMARGTEISAHVCKHTKWMSLVTKSGPYRLDNSTGVMEYGQPALGKHFR